MYLRVLLEWRFCAKVALKIPLENAISVPAFALDPFLAIPSSIAASALPSSSCLCEEILPTGALAYITASLIRSEPLK